MSKLVTKPRIVETLASYVPVMLVRRAIALPNLPNTPIQENFPAAVLFADISGFTSLTEKLGQHGLAGVEELTTILNQYFCNLIALLTAHGGDVIKFAGDALLAIWSATDEPLATATHRAAQCSLAILKQFNDYLANDTHLTLHIGLGAGEVMGLHVGGVNRRWEFLLAGAPLFQIASAATRAQSGQVCISPQGWELIQDKFAGTVLASGEVLLDKVLAPLSPYSLEVPTLVPEIAPVVQAYIPQGILARLNAGQTDWLAEIRCVTVLFMQLPEINSLGERFLKQLQQVMQEIQTTIWQYEGEIRQLIIDDKGCVLIAAFGLPPFAHEDDAKRALLAALNIREKINRLGLMIGIGITRGRVYCGLVGCGTRCEYAMVGATVNLAARLMAAAKDEIWCDEATYQATQGELTFTTCPPIKVKGKAEPVAIYCPSAQAQVSCRLRMPMIGRTAERQLLNNKLQALLTGESGVVVLAGEAGIGKSRLVDELRTQAENLGVMILEGSGDAIEKSTPYFAWRNVFSRLLEVDRFPDPEALQNHLLTQLSQLDHLSRFAPLLNAIAPLDLPENDITSQMTGQVRADNTRELLVALLQIAVSQSPQLLILEDIHWIDSASWALTLAISQRVQPLLLVMTTRPLTDPLPKEYWQLLQGEHTQLLKLEALSSTETLSLMCQQLGVATLPESIAQLISQKAEGNPFFTEELAFALRESGLLIIAEGEGKVKSEPTLEQLNNLHLPDTVQGAIASRIDRLAPPLQLAVKVASTIGRTFAFRILHDIHPLPEDRTYLAEYLQKLATLEITSVAAAELQLSYIFKHIITQEVAYNLMLFAQRRQLHYAIAQWYERHYPDDLAPFYPVLAYHWSHAIEAAPDNLAISKAIDYLEKAGEQALRSHSLREAVNFFNQAITFHHQLLATEVIPHPESLREAAWERQLGEAYLGLGQLPESRQHLTKALFLLGRPIPTGKLNLSLGLLRQILSQILYRLGYIGRVNNGKQLIFSLPFQSQTNPKSKIQNLKSDDSSTEQCILLETARIYDQLAEIHYHANEIICTIYSCIRSLNLAERAAASRELARTYANSCFAAGTIPLHTLAKIYSQRGRETAQQVDPGGETEARVLVVTSAYKIGIGQWQEVETALNQGVEICTRLGDRHQLGNCLAILAKARYLQGQFARGIELWEEIYRIATRSRDILQQAWGLNGQAEGILRLGDPDQAVRLLHESLTLFAQNTDRVSQTATYGMLAIAYLYQGELQLAKQVAETTRSRLEQFTSPSSYYLIQGYAGVAQVFLTLWKQNFEQFEISKSARKACQALHKYARVFPIGQPYAWLYQGWYHWLNYEPRLAHQAWERSLTIAKQLAMPYEQGLIHYQIGIHSTDEERQQHLKSAREIFTRLGTTCDLERTIAAINHARTNYILIGNLS